MAGQKEDIFMSYTTQERIKKVVEHICCDYTRGSLEDACRFYYDAYNRQVEKASRGELENIVYALIILNIDPAGIYEVSVDGQVLKPHEFAHEVIRYILRQTIFNWHEEAEYPVTKDGRHAKVTIKKIATRTI